MSKQNTIYLGYEDEFISEKHKPDISYVTNKIGGRPDWPPLEGLKFNTKCPLCGVVRPLVLQCYAPLLNSPFHRTLYVFGCINPTCWNSSDSWSCIRSQYVDTTYTAMESNEVSHSCDVPKIKSGTSNWCTGADEWDVQDNADMGDFGDTCTTTSPTSITSIKQQNPLISDDDDDVMDTLEAVVGNMQISNDSSHTILTKASAEIEVDESGEITVETPVIPKNNIAALFSQVPKLPSELISGVQSSIHFEGKFITVSEEYLSEDYQEGHIKALMQEYEKKNSKDMKSSNSKEKSGKSKEDTEEYEKGIPHHGNELFHAFLTRIQKNPSQVLRYSWGGDPLIMSPLPASLRTTKCRNCKGNVWFELQILPTMIPSLSLLGSQSTHLEFGTVLIYSCKESCWKDNDVFVMETVFAQSEPA